MYGGGRTVDRRTLVGESSDEWLIFGSAMRTVMVVRWEWKYRGVGSVVGVFKVDWSCGRGIVEVYK